MPLWKPGVFHPPEIVINILVSKISDKKVIHIYNYCFTAFYLHNSIHCGKRG